MTPFAAELKSFLTFPDVIVTFELTEFFLLRLNRGADGRGVLVAGAIGSQGGRGKPPVVASAIQQRPH